MANMVSTDGVALFAGLRVKVKATGESDKTGIITLVEYPGQSYGSVKGKIDDGELFDCKKSDVSVEAIGRNRTRTLD